MTVHRVGRRISVTGLLCLAPFASVHAQGGFLMQGVVDGEAWKTDSASALLARNDGRAATLARLCTWAAAEPWTDVVLFGALEGETGRARPEAGSEVYLEQYGLRLLRSERFVFQVGKMPHPVGVYASRHMSYRNPLIGDPDGYSLVYPLGASMSGSASIFDYRAGVVSLPLTHEGYTPDPSPSPRPAVGFGVTPVTGVRIGASATVGPYLRSDLAPALLDGRSWRAYQQRVVAADAQISRGYLELFGEAAYGSYDVPGHVAANGLTYYVESKYTLTPRLYVAARVERNDYPFIAPLGGTQWTSSSSDFSDAELGTGFRVSASTLLKLSARADRWAPPRSPYAPSANGHALAMQVSRTFDVMDAIGR
ncbi:MAG TPA: hypothetical protein VGG78_07170 [Gemmatimonadaceae bacterium]